MASIPNSAKCVIQTQCRGGSANRTTEIFSKLCRDGLLDDALGTAEIIQEQGISITRNNVYSLLLECDKRKELKYTRQVLSLMICNGLDVIAALSDHVVRLLSYHERLLEANQSFSKIGKPSVHTWAAIILANANLHEGHAALELYHRMQLSGLKIDKYISVAVLKACTVELTLPQGRVIHGQIIRSELEVDVMTGNTLVHMYATCGNLEDSCRIFNHLESPSSVSWNAMIAGYAQHGENVLALECFQKMEDEGIRPNVVSWTAVIAGYAQHGEGHFALECFNEMQEACVVPNEVTFVNMLNACASIGALEHGRIMHSCIIKRSLYSDIALGNTLVHMYAMCQSLEEACKAFDRVSNRDIVSWNAMLAGYAQNGENSTALECFQKMKQEGMMPNLVSWNAVITGFAQKGDSFLALQCYEKMVNNSVLPNEVTFSSVLKACGSIGALVQGRNIHQLIIKNGITINTALGNILVDMYAKCGNLEEAGAVFLDMSARDLLSWNVMISGYAQHGQGHLALEYLAKMQHDNIKPDNASFTSVLIACSREGLIDEGSWCFKYMRDYFGMNPAISHYACMVDILGRAGYLDEAEDFLQTTIGSDIVGWTTLLSACKMHGNSDVAWRCFDQLIILDCQYAPGYVLMSNIFADDCFLQPPA